MQPYTKGFYEEIAEGSRRSAKQVVPLVLELVEPKSVIDVGCGVGAWLAVFREAGVEDLLGVDGDYVGPQLLQIPAERFQPFDLKKPFSLRRQFDLVVSLEVAEHLPAACAPGFVDSLIRLGPVVLFSAAIPFQGGIHHLNEQWPDYWADLFQTRSFVRVDCLRSKLWDNPQVDWWYAQNLQLFVKKDYLERSPRLRQEFQSGPTLPPRLVHPKCFLAAADPENHSFLKTVSTLPRLFLRALRRRGSGASRSK